MESKICQENGNSLSEYDPTFLIPLIVVNALTVITAVILNALVILTILRTPSLRTPSRILLCSLALADLLFGATVQLLFVVFALHALIKSFQVFCISSAIIRRFGYSLGMVTIETLAAMSIDRCLAIKAKAAYRNIVTRKRVIIFLVLAWLLGFAVVLSSIQLADVRTLSYTSSLCIASMLSIMTVSYSMSFHSLKKLSSQVANIQSIPNPNQAMPENHASSNFNIRKYKRSLITTVMILALGLLSYLPLISYNLFYLFVRKSVAMLHTAEFLVALNSTLNPILYLWRMKDLREAAKKTLSLE